MSLRDREARRRRMFFSKLSFREEGWLSSRAFRRIETKPTKQSPVRYDMDDCQDSASSRIDNGFNKENYMKILVCDKTEKEAMTERAGGLSVDVRDDITPEDLIRFCQPMTATVFVPAPKCASR